MFEKAARKKIRFASPQGLLSTEDLFDLPLTSTTGRANLDDIAKGINKQIRESGEESFVNPEKGADENLQTAFQIVLHVINFKKSEAAAKATLVANKEKKARLLALIEQKRNSELGEKSIDELLAMAEGL